MGLGSSWPRGPIGEVHSTWCPVLNCRPPSPPPPAALQWGREGGGLGFSCLGNLRCHLSCVCWSTSCSWDIVLIQSFFLCQTDLLLTHSSVSMYLTRRVELSDGFELKLHIKFNVYFMFILTKMFSTCATLVTRGVFFYISRLKRAMSVHFPWIWDSNVQANVDSLNYIIKIV